MTETRPLRDTTALAEQDGPVVRARPPRRPAPGWLVAGVAVALVLGGLLAWRLLPGSAQAEDSAWITQEARVADLEDRVEAAATVAYPQSATADLRVAAAGTVTAVGLREGDRPGPLAVVLEVGDAPVAALPSPLPLYRDLAEGAEGADVEALENALRAAGHDPGPPDAVFDATTTAALQDWQAATGLEETGVLSLAQVVWLPPGGQVTAVAVRPGDPVAPGTPLGSVADPAGLVVEASLDQADVARVAGGATAEVELDALADPVAATVEAVAVTPGEDGTYRATLRPAALPEGLRAGMQGTAQVLAGVRTGVVVVPTGAVAGTAADATVRVLVDGEPQTRPVELGLVTTDGAEIVSGVAAGDAIVVGERG